MAGAVAICLTARFGGLPFGRDGMSANDDGQAQENRRLNSWKEIAAFFGKRKPGIPERDDWRALVNDVQAAPAS